MNTSTPAIGGSVRPPARRPVSRCTRVDEVALHFTEAGSGDAVVLVHGMPTSSFLWRHVQAALADEFRTFAPDLLGFGESDKPEYRDVSIGAEADLVAHFVRQLGLGAVTLVGHDLGGAVAQVVAAQHPGIVSRLILIDSVGVGTWPHAHLERFRPAEVARRTTVEEILRHLRDTLPRQAHKPLDPGALEGYLAPWSTPTGMGSFFKIARAADSRVLADVEPELSRLWIPSLVVWGEADPVTPLEEGRRLASLLPSAELAVLAGVGHLAPEEAPGLVAAQIQSFHRRTAKYL